MTAFTGQCHCGAITFSVETDLESVLECNCSICSRKGILHHKVQPKQFRLFSGEDALTDYQFGTHTAHHLFCKHCGIHTFCRPRSAPALISVNVRCLDFFHDLQASLKTVPFDGRLQFKS